MHYIIKVRFLDGTFFSARLESPDVLQDFLNGFAADKEIIYMEIIKFEE